MAPVACLASGLGFTEGPVWTGDGRLLVTSVSRGLVYEVNAGQEARVLVETGGGPNGMAEDASGQLWITQNGGSVRASRSDRPADPGIQVAGDGRVADVVATGLGAPSDCAFGPDGRLWFTDPGRLHQASRPPGRILTLDPASGEIEVARDDATFPNGIAFGPDPDQLFVADTFARRVTRYRCTTAGLSDPVALALLPRGAPDGIAFDAAGRLHVAASFAEDEVAVFDGSGRYVERIDLGGPYLPTNVCFGGPDLATLFVTTARGGRVLAIERDVPGLAVRGGAGGHLPG